MKVCMAQRPLGEPEQKHHLRAVDVLTGASSAPADSLPRLNNSADRPHHNMRCRNSSSDPLLLNTRAMFTRNDPRLQNGLHIVVTAGKKSWCLTFVLNSEDTKLYLVAQKQNINRDRFNGDAMATSLSNCSY